uniref:lysophospholipid acyltransferase family protein n=1 Tax=Agathobacter sp. TaxID=2021311 RepID=UPI004057AD5B
MVRLIFVLLVNGVRLFYMLPLMRRMAKNPQKYSEERCYRLARHIVRTIKVSAGTRTKAYGTENLPKTGGYMMYPNHQGKYDVFGIINTHKQPCTLVMDKQKSYWPIINEAVGLLNGKRLDREDVRQAITVINEVAKEVKNGRRYILFPEGDYRFNNKNRIGEFKRGSFKISLMSKTPIVPVVLVNSYKVFDSFNIFGPVTTQVHYLPPIFYEEYKNRKTKEIAEMVQGRIEEKMEQIQQKQRIKRW